MDGDIVLSQARLSITWLVLPQEIKDLIDMLIQMGMMMLVMWLMMSVIKPLMASERPKRIEEAK